MSRAELRIGPPGPIDAMPLDVSIASHEGVSLDYAVSLRMSYLAAQSATLARQTQFADTKAGAVLAFAGLVGARVAMDLDRAAPDAAGLALIGLTALVLALCLLVLMPRYPTGALRDLAHGHERFSWVALSAPCSNADDYAAFTRRAEVSQLLVSMARSNHAMARVLRRKFAFLRAAFLLAVLDIGLAAAYFLNLVNFGVGPIALR